MALWLYVGVSNVRDAHDGKVFSLHWTSTSSLLISCGPDGHMVRGEYPDEIDNYNIHSVHGSYVITS